MPYFVLFVVTSCDCDTGDEQTRKFTVQFDSEEAFNRAEAADYMWDHTIPRFNDALMARGINEHVDGAIEVVRVDVECVTPDFVY